MATITGLTAERMLGIEAATIVSGEIDVSGHLILTRFDGTQIDAGIIASAVPDASETQKGVVELATEAETVALADNTKAITPGGLASTINGLSGRLITHIDTAKPQSDLISTYPGGVSIMSLNPTTVVSGSWTGLTAIWGSEVYGVVHTVNPNSGYAVQYFFRHGASTVVPAMAIRSGNSASWGTWQRVVMYDEWNTANSLRSARIASGGIFIQAVANTPTTGTVTFPAGRFTSIPNVVATGNSATGNIDAVTVGNISTTGCVINLTRPSAVNTAVYWVAVEN